MNEPSELAELARMRALWREHLKSQGKHAATNQKQEAGAKLADQCSLTIQDHEVIAVSSEGKQASMALEDFIAKVAARRMDTGGMVLPTGIKAVITEGPITILVYERPPCIHRFRWITKESPVPFGPGAQYRDVRLALPYVIILAVFAMDVSGQMQLTGANECFFRVAPIKSLEDALFYPGLLNCSRFEPPEGRPLSWICTQHLKRSPLLSVPDANKRLMASFDSLCHCLFETGFNLSSEHHEYSSWFTESCKVDARIQTVEAWEAASAQDPLFILDVPWLPTHHTIRQVTERIFKQQQVCCCAPRSAAALARIIFNHQKPASSPS